MSMCPPCGHDGLGIPRRRSRDTKVSGLREGRWGNWRFGTTSPVLDHHWRGTFQVSVHKNITLVEVSAVEEFALHGITSTRKNQYISQTKVDGGKFPMTK